MSSHRPAVHVLPRVLLLASLLVLPGTPGCLFVGGKARFGAPVPPDAAASIVRGQTTKAELLARLGPPTEYKQPEYSSALVDDQVRLSGVLATARRAEHVLTWQYDSVSAAGTYLLLYSRLSAATATDLLVVFFDEHDVVVDFAWGPAERAP